MDLETPPKDRKEAESRMNYIFNDIRIYKEEWDIRPRMMSALQHVVECDELLGFDFIMDKYVFPALENLFPLAPMVLEDTINMLLGYCEEKYVAYGRFLQKLIRENSRDAELVAYPKAAYIIYDTGWDPVNYETVIPSLIESLDERQLIVRAAAAYSLGSIYCQRYDGVFKPEPKEILKIITEKDANLPGIAASFYSAFEYERETFEDLFETNPKNWLTNILKNTKQPEVELPNSLSIAEFLERFD